MAINMPHEGGLEALGVLFGTRPKDTKFVVVLWVGTPPTGIDYDDADMVGGVATDSEAWLIANGAHMSAEFGTEYEPGTLLGELTQASALQSKITLTGGVPQIEFPQYSIVFKDTFTNPVYGYAVVGGGANVTPETITMGKVYFREKFTTPFEPAGKRLVFIPTLKLGNTTCPLT